jgi:hypothetical protein
MKAHMKTSHSVLYNQYFNLSRDERLGLLKNEIPDNRVGTIHQHVDVTNIQVKIEGCFVDLLINKLIVEEIDNISRERAKAIFGNLIDGHYLISVHANKFKTIQTMVCGCKIFYI